MKLPYSLSLLLLIWLSMSKQPQAQPVNGISKVRPVAAPKATGNGLRGDYYNGQNFDEKVLSRIDKQLNFHFFRKSPGPGVYAENYSVRWTGQLLAPVTGTYQIIVHVDDGIRLWLGGKLLIDDWHIQEEVTHTREVALTAGRFYDLKVEYCNGPTITVLKLAWECPKDAVAVFGVPVYTPEEIIPQQYLFSQPIPELLYPTPPPVAIAAPAVAKAAPTPKPTPQIIPQSVPTVSTGETSVSVPLPKPLPLVSRYMLSSSASAKNTRATASLSESTSPVTTSVAINQIKDSWDNLETDKPLVLKNVFFAQSKALLLSESHPELDRLVKTIQKLPYLQIAIAGHTDNVGSRRQKDQLAIRRAQVVADYLMQHGVAATRITTRGYGDRRPLTGNGNEAERAQNRRVEFTVSASKITQVENNLLPWVQYADSSYRRFSLRDRMAFYQVPSVSMAVINNGRVEWTKAYGLADVTEQKPATPQTLYQAASISKAVNSLGIMRLEQAGRLTLNKDIRSYLKTWTWPKSEYSQNGTITLANLLSHTAGLSTEGFRGYQKGENLPDLNQILNAQLPANSEAVRVNMPPHQTVRYSGGGILLTQKILEDNISSNYAELLRQQVFKPLGMKHSTFAFPLPASKVQVIATGYHANGQALTGRYNLYPELAAAGLWTTPRDLAKCILAIQESLDGRNQKFLYRATTNQMLRPVLENDRLSALGFFIEEKGGEKYFTHGGHNTGYNAVFYGSFSTKTGVVIMINSDNMAIIPEIVNSVATTYQWKNFYQPVIKQVTVMPAASLDQYAGVYTIRDAKVGLITVTVQNRNGQLQIKRNHGTWENIVFTAENQFFLDSVPYSLQFVATNNRIDQIVIKDGRTIFIARKE